jgi:activating signal cointegrator complex subunit 2
LGEDRRRLQEEVFDVMASVLSSQSFVLRYDKLYPLVDQVALLKTSAFHLDAAQIDYLEESIRTLGLINEKCSNGTSMSALEHDANGQMKGMLSVAGAVTPPERDISVLISKVQELFPSLGIGFIEACLEEFSWDAEQVIDAMLEDKLPPVLQGMDRKIEKIPYGIGELPDKPQEEKSDLGHDILSKRHNVFDNDEMDVFRHAEVDMSRVRYKERERKTDALKLLDDKSLVSSIRDRYLDVEYDEYNDEYDDTYDSTSAAPDTSATEASDFLIKRLNKKVPLYRYVDDENTEQPEEESEEAEDQQQQQQKKPEQQQQPKQEQITQQQQLKQEQRRQGRGVGASTGRGQRQQSGPEQRERAFKEKHKGSWANHNRKMASQKKRSKGMGFPT